MASMIDRTNGSGYLEIVCGCEHKGECTAVGTRGLFVDVNIMVSVRQWAPADRVWMRAQR